MAFFKFLFYAIFFLLIKLGDAVYFVLFSLASIAVTPFRKSFHRAFYKKKNGRKKEKRQKLQDKKTIRYNRTGDARIFQIFLRKIVLFTKRVGMLVLDLLREILLLLLSVITAPRRLTKAIFGIRHRHKKRGRPPLPVKPPFLFKIKYIVVGAIFALFLFFLPATFLIFISDLPKLSNLSVNYISKTTKIMDRNGTLLFEIYANQNRTIVGLNQIPLRLKQATIAIEDREFYKHNGFDLKGMARALYVDVTKNDLQGGSTITQQLVKSALLTPETTITRKARELVLALWAEKKYTKDEILELYFNYVPYGGTAWGIEAASQIYFGKHVSELTLSESAYLAGLPQAPSQYSPFAGDGDKGKRRQKDVLNAMVSEGYITRSQAQKAYSEKLVFESPQIPIQAPHFVMYVKDQLIRKYGILAIERGGLQVITTLDLNSQKIAENIVSEEVERDGHLGIGNGASLVTNPQNGDILAMVGSRDYFDPEHDGNVNITTSLRQPGSTIKLVTYALALSEGLTEATIIDDQPLTIRYPGGPSYTPVNYDGKYHGRVPIRIALANSFNIPAVKLTQRFGVEKLVAFGKQLGITSWGSPDNYGVSITLGAAEVSMIDLATAYGVVANSGDRVDLDPILKITDSEGKILQEKKVQGVRVLDPGVAFIISDILADNRARSIAFGSNTPLVIPERKVSVKTGTTDNKRDNWTIGYTPNLLVVTWVGNNDNTPLSQALASGITGAAPIWNKIMTTLLQEREFMEVQKPGNIVTKQCFGYEAYFIQGTEGNGCRIILPSPTLQQQ
ncbi:MAG: PBP1A family penicillin-binding protein [Candidatus Levybacteria bacterium]|nr:PBP1A family penicillin-binding protein [Candidatus Levybacteria bacterium]